MTSSKKTTGTALALAAAALLATAPLTAQAGSQKGRCMGANSCRGHGTCKTATNSCMGQNSCKGKGFLDMTQHECEGAGGEFQG